MLLDSHKVAFKRDCITMRNYVGTCKCICSFNLVYKVLIELFPLQNSVFVVYFSNIFAWEQGIFKW